MTMAKQALEDGVFLEETGVLIPWGITAADASVIGSPRVVQDGVRNDILWGPESIFCGLKATVHATLYGNQRLNRLEIAPTWPHANYDLQAHYRFTRDRLIEALGEPDETSEDALASMPSYTWNANRSLRLRLWLFDRFGEQLKLGVGYLDKSRLR